MRDKKFTKIMLVAVILITVVTAFIFVCSGSEPDGDSQEKITDFLAECGYTVANPVTKEITIPENFSEVYTSYNEIQKKQGFDLSRYKGKSATLYTFTVIGYINEQGEPENHIEAHVIVCGGKIVGADVSSTRLDGFMKGVRSK